MVSLRYITAKAGLQELHLIEVPGEVEQNPASRSHLLNALELFPQLVCVRWLTSFAATFSFFVCLGVNLIVINLRKLLDKLFFSRDASFELSL